MRIFHPSFIPLCAAVCLLAPVLMAAPGNPEEVKAAMEVKQGWSSEIKAALGGEDGRFWRGGDAVSEPRHEGASAIRWADHKINGNLQLLSAPDDLSAFNSFSFWLHADRANGDTFMIVLESLHTEKQFSYFCQKVAVDWTGWRKLVFRFRDFGKVRSPAGWQKIDCIRFSATGWNQDPSGESVWVVDDLDFQFDDTPYRPRIEVAKYLEEPGAEAFLKRLSPDHPRIIMLDEDLARIRTFIETDPRGKQWCENARGKAESLFRKPVRKHELPDGRRLLSISRDVLDRLFHWGFFYRLDGDPKWLDRAWQEMSAVVDFPDWNPSHYLDTAEMMHAVGLGYDWFYHGLTEDQRKTIRDGLWQHGLRLSYAAYMGLEAEGSQGWRQVTNNWNFVCNGGTALAAMAVLDEMPDTCADLMNISYQYIQIPIRNFEPDGAWWEGLGYWGYSMRYFLAYLRGMETAFGTDFGFTEALKGTGFEHAGDMPVYLVSPIGGIFSFADSGSGMGRYQHWALFDLASRFNNPLYQHFQEQQTSGTLYDLIYYRPVTGALAPQSVALDKYFRKTEVASMRSSWTDRNAFFAGIKCGKNGIAHAHQDLGSFIFHALGEQWVIDMGTEGQTYQSHKHHLPGWQFYRIRSEGHNTLVFDPAEKDCQDAHGAAAITRFESTPAETIAVADLSNPYRGFADSVTRGFRLFDQRRAFLVQDEIRGTDPHEIWWFAHSVPGTEFSVDDSGRSAILSRNGKQCHVFLLSPEGARFTVMDTRPLPTSPDPDIQNPNKGFRKLAVHLAEVAQTTIAVVFRPRYDFEPIPEAGCNCEPIADWRAAATSGPSLREIAVAGVPLADFSPGVYTYGLEFPEEAQTVSSLTATAEAGATATVDLPGAIPGTATIRVASPGSPQSSLYTVRFLHTPPPPPSAEKPQSVPKPVTIRGITVTASHDDGNHPGNVLDGDPATRWSANGSEEWIAFDFGQKRELASMGIAWFNGDRRRSTFVIRVSDDGSTWRQVFAGQSNGTTTEVEAYPFARRESVRYLRITGSGNSDNLWNSITEVQFP